MRSEELTDRDLERQTIAIYEPFAGFLGGSGKETKFTISLLDAVRLSGHACMAVTGAFICARAAVEELFPDTKVCERGLLEVFMPGRPDEGATGPIANVLSYVTGAWGPTGFGGLGDGRFQRRNRLHFGCDLPNGVIRFTRMDTKKSVDIRYSPQNAVDPADADKDFQVRWRGQIARVLADPAKVLTRTIG